MVKINKSEKPGEINRDEDYRKGPVFCALVNDCFRKCYLCEIKLSAFNVEHIVPRSTKPELAHEWSNLLLACPHCNGIKNDKYDNILNCTEVDPEDVISIKYEPYPMFKLEFGVKEVDEPLATQGRLTAELLNMIFTVPPTDLKFHEAEELRRILINDMLEFTWRLLCYKNASVDRNKQIYLASVSEHIVRSSQFAAIKRAVVRNPHFEHKELMAELD